MELVLTLLIMGLYSSGIYMMLRRSMVKLLIGIILLGNGANLLIFMLGRITKGKPPVIPEDAQVFLDIYADPVPQALILTAIVISFATTALFLVVLLASRGITGTDHVDGREPER